jgi:hypothetical protein
MFTNSNCQRNSKKTVMEKIVIKYDNTIGFNYEQSYSAEYIGYINSQDFAEC